MFKIPIETDFDVLDFFSFGETALFIDAGANRGETVRAIRMKYPRNKVLAFEPNPIIFEKTKRSFRRDESTTFVNVGLSDKDEEWELKIPFYKKYMFDGLASFKEDEALDWLRTRIYFFSEKNLELRRVKCKLKTLDGFDVNPEFIKIDVQGYEMRVLWGAKQTIKRNLPVLLIETPTQEVSDYLKGLGYWPFQFDGSAGLLPGFGRLNTFFINESSPVYRRIPKEEADAPPTMK